ncbi:glycosyl transferase [Actinocatenispora thailandica]|uniref:Glycosyl transferase n=1 Tax=Actinocatenispora thailandica TaxID=227318 RepID=A0A7R7DPL7_9ACTN|nr:glycosyltransferase family 4 protein [Actinocatenispora thailandica]BCJ35550.1 glycosyl transferase [Actinocatenispora thailandica]
MADVRDRVALVLPTSTGGIGRHVGSLAAALVRDGHPVRVLGPREVAERFDFGAAAFRPVPISAGLNPARDLPALAALAAGLRGADVVHAHGMRAGLLAALARPRSAPLVVTWHNLLPNNGSGPRQRLLAALERRLARSATVHLCASDDLVDRVLRLGGRDVRPAPVAAPSLPPPRRDAAQVRAELGAVGRPLVLSVGRLHQQKGYDLLVDAAARWRGVEPRPLLVIAGDGPERAALTDRIAATGSPVTLLGHRDDVADLLAACDLAVVSSRWEARQLFAQEALAAGRPLVCTAVGGVPGLVCDAAVLVPAGDGDALAGAVEALLADPARRSELAARARDQAARWPTEADTVAQVEAVYAELLE